MWSAPRHYVLRLIRPSSPPTDGGIGRRRSGTCADQITLVGSAINVSSGAPRQCDQRLLLGFCVSSPPIGKKPWERAELVSGILTNVPRLHIRKGSRN